MIVHVVKPGETMWRIATNYGTTVASIMSANGFTSDALVPGLALAIPSGSAYTVRQYTVSVGDTLWSISRQFGITLELLLAYNPPLSPHGLIPGQILLVPIAVTAKRWIETNAYLVLSNVGQDDQWISAFSSYLTFVSPFTYTFTAAGIVKPAAVIMPSLASVKYLLVLANSDATGQFSGDLAHQVFVNPQSRQTLIDGLIAELRRLGYSGVNLDIEHIYPADRYLYNDFVAQVAASLRALGYAITIAVPPKPNDDPYNEWVGGFDYKALGDVVDRVMLMTYDWGFPAGKPEAVAPVDKIRAVLNYALSLMDSRKVLLGMPLYGDDWPLPHTPIHPATIIGNQNAVANAIAQGAWINVDPLSVTPNYMYYDARGTSRIVWYNDSLTILAKAELVMEYDMAGFFYWALGYDFPQNWYLLNDVFDIIK